MTAIETAVALKKELDALRPINRADELRIIQKFRLDWNFHSNNLEGNTLTYGETKALILFGITAQGKPLKDHLEVTGHDEAIKWVDEVIREERPLTENFIRQLHQLILKEDYQVDAITPDGKPTKKWVRVGKYKTEPNHVLTKTGEIFRFAAPEETPAKMSDLLEWYRKKKEQNDTNPILLAAEFHYRFIRIHPFDDGNGRTARILMNFIMMQHGYPPVVIKTQDKENYFAALRQADAGLIEPFVEYIASNLVLSLEIMIRGAEGEDIEEPDDLDKEISLLEKKLESVDKRHHPDEDIMESLFERSVAPLFRKFVISCKKFDRFYRESSYSLIIGNRGWSDTDIEDIINKIRPMLNKHTEKIEMSYTHSKIDRIGLENFGHYSHIFFLFSSSNSMIISNSNSYQLEKPYSEQLTEKEMNRLIGDETKKHKEIIEQKIAELRQMNGEK